MTDAPSTDRDPLVLAPGEGRSYPMGRLSAVSKGRGPRMTPETGRAVFHLGAVAGSAHKGTGRPQPS